MIIADLEIFKKYANLNRWRWPTLNEPPPGYLAIDHLLDYEPRQVVKEPINQVHHLLSYGIGGFVLGSRLFSFQRTKGRCPYLYLLTFPPESQGLNLIFFSES